MFKLNYKLAITNGTRPITDFGDTKGQYSNGVKYYIIKNVLVIDTSVLIKDGTDEEILAQLEAGVLDSTWPLRQFGGGDPVAKRIEVLKKSIKERAEAAVRRKKLLDVLDMYPNIPEALKKRMVNLDHYYSYSDDRGVYKAGMESHEQLKKELSPLIGGVSFYEDYLKAIFSL